MPKIDYFSNTEVLADLKSKTIRGGAITAIGQAGQILIQFLSIPILARLLSPADFGLIAMSLFFTGFARLFVDAGLSIATVQRPTITHQQVSNLFWLATGIGFLCTLSIVALAPVIAWFYEEPRLVGVTVALGLGFMFSGLTVQHIALLQRTMQFRTLAMMQVLAALVAQGIGIFWAWKYGDYWALVWLSLALPIVRLIISWTCCRWLPSWPRRNSGVREMVAFGANVFGYNFINYLTTNIDRMLIGWYWGATPLGYYERAFRMLHLPLRQINGPATGVAISALSRVAGEPKKYRSVYLQMAQSTMILMCPLLIYLACSADWCVQWMLGSPWLQTVPIFRWLAAASIVQIATIVVGWLLISQDRSKELLQFGILGAIPIILSFAFALSWGPLRVVQSFAVTNLLIVLPMLFWWAGRRGAVTTLDLWKTLLQVLPYMIVMAAINLTFQWLIKIDRPIYGLLATIPLSFVGWLLVAVSTSSGQTFLRHLSRLPVISRLSGAFSANQDSGKKE